MSLAGTGRLSVKGRLVTDPAAGGTGAPAPAAGDAGLPGRAAMSRPASRAFSVRQDQAGGRILVRLAGELDVGGVELLAACADQICRQPAVAEVRLDLSGLTFLDGAGAQTLAAACNCLRRDGRRVKVTGIRARVRRVLDLLGLVLAADHD